MTLFSAACLLLLASHISDAQSLQAGGILLDTSFHLASLSAHLRCMSQCAVTTISTGTLAPGASLNSGVRLFSNDGGVYLSPQTDGNLVLYHASLVAKIGESASSALWASGTYGRKDGPFTLVMQPVRAHTLR